MIDHEELKRLCAEATEEPWVFGCEEADCGPNIYFVMPANDMSVEGTIATLDTGEHDNEANCAFICASRTAIPALLEENERLREALKPFARVAKYADGDAGERIFGRADYAGSDWREITLGDLRGARSVLQPKENG